MEREPEIGHPFSQFLRSPWVVVVEMCSSREDFDGLESVTGDIGEVLARQPAFVEEMSGNAEAMIRQASNYCNSLSQFLQVLCQQFPQPGEPGIARQVGPREGQRPRNVLNVDRVVP